GLCSLAMEVVWTRAFTPLLGNTTYAFASLLIAYLTATVLGSRQYRSDVTKGKVKGVAALLAALILSSIVPLVLNDPRIAYLVLPGLLAIKATLASLGFTPLNTWLVIRGAWALLTIIPYCYILGYLTPQIIDRLSRGSSRVAGSAYALNTVGCIIGPLLAG